MNIDTVRRVARKRLTDPADHPDGLFLQFSARHNRVMKAYTAELTVAQRTGRAVITTTRLYGDNPHTIAVEPEPVTRYSARRFETFARDVLHELERRTDELAEHLAVPAEV